MEVLSRIDAHEKFFSMDGKYSDIGVDLTLENSLKSKLLSITVNNFHWKYYSIKARVCCFKCDV